MLNITAVPVLVGRILLNTLLLLCFLIPFRSAAQGDNCANALPLQNLSNFCSNQGQYTNVGSTPSGFSAATCWTGGPLEDVWFSFVAIGSDVLISIHGNSMMRPRIAIYTGDCAGTLTQPGAGCNNGSAGSPDSQLYVGGLTQGMTYLIRISTTAANEGTFQLCINNYTPPPSVSADCNGAGRLCNKNPVSVSNMSGGGANVNENNGTCISGWGITESNSVWYTWTCQTAGTLTMDILPANQADDIDFALFQLNTTNPCGPRTLIRCTAASCTNALASTGMNATSTDVTEPLDCPFGSDAYVQQINMTAGTSYAILIMNATAANGFTINWGGTGTFTGPDANITSPSLTVCAGEPVTLDGSTSTNYTNLNWNFLNGPGSPNSATGPGPHTVTYPNAGSYTAILNATGNGCTSVEAVNVTVTESATPAFTAIGPLCEGAAAPPLPTTSNNGITGTWSPSTVNTAATGTTTYTFTPDAGQCSAPATMDVTISPSTSTVTFAAVPAFCEGSPAPAFPAQTSTPTVTGTWSPAAISTTASGTYTFTPDAGSCASAATINITVNPLPTVTISSNTPLCVGDALNLTANTVAGGTYDWSGPNGFDSSDEDPVRPGVILSDGGNYTLQLTDANGCVSQASTNVVVGNSVTPVLTAVGPFCSENTTPVSLAANIPGGTWSGNGVTDPNGTFVPSTAGTGTHTITYTHTQGCGGTATMNIVVDDAPPANFTADILLGCAPLTVSFTSDPGMESSEWTFGDNTTASGIGGVTHTYANPGTYTVTLTNTLNGCSTTNSVTNYITVFADPVAAFDVSSTVLTQVSTEVIFYNNSNNATSYSWDFGDETTSTATNPIHTYPQEPGSYTIILTAFSAGGCSDQATLTIVVREDQVIYVPNAFTPDGDEFNNEFKPVLSEGFDLYNYTLLIYNRWGEVIFESMNAEAGWDGTYHGKPVKEGAYSWTIRVKNRTEDKFNVYNGHVLVIR